MQEAQTRVIRRRRWPLTGVRRWLLPRRDGLGRRLAYAVLSLPLAVAYVGLFALLVLAVITSAQGVGLLVFLGVLMLARGFGGLERRATRSLLGVEVEEGIRLRRQPGGVVRRARGLLTASSTWRALAWLGARVLAGAAVLATVVFAGGLAYLLLTYDTQFDVARTVWRDLLSVSGLLLLGLVAVRVLDAQVRIVAAAAPALLGVSAQERVEALRQTSVRLAERNSVARDLHDTIGHTLTASLLQAGAARRTLSPDPDEPDRAIDPSFARQAIAHIEDNTRTALAELDRALAVLGDRRDARGAEAAAPAPDLSDVGALVAGLRDGGLPITLRLAVSPDDVAPAVSRLAYRIVQEGTTNVLRHAGTPATTVDVGRNGDQLVVRVRNDPPTRRGSRPGPGGGHGIAGLSERTVALGGRLSAGPTSTGGFELSATLPLRGGG